MFVHHSQHTQSLKATEHPASDRVDLIGCEVKLIDRRCTFKCPIFNLCDLVVAEVTVRKKLVRKVNVKLFREKGK